MADYYLSPTGNDASPGTQAQPWRYMQKFIDVAAPGDRLLVMSGTNDQRGHPYPTKGVGSGKVMAHLVNKDWGPTGITIEGLPGNLLYCSSGIEGYGNVRYLTIKNLNIRVDANGAYANGIFIDSEVTAGYAGYNGVTPNGLPSWNITVTGCTVGPIPGSSADEIFSRQGISVWGMDYLTVTDNKVWNCARDQEGNFGGAGSCYSFGHARRKDTLQGRHFYFARNMGWHASGSTVNPDANGSADRNIFILDLFHTLPDYAVGEVRIENNIFMDAWGRGIHVFAAGLGDAPVVICNNTVLAPFAGHLCSAANGCSEPQAGIGGYGGNPVAPYGSKFFNIWCFNNLVVGDNTKSCFQWEGVNVNGAGSFNGTNNWAFQGPATFNGTTQPAGFLAGTTNPLLVNAIPNGTGDYRLQAGSPLRGRGVPSLGGFAAPTTDYYGNVRTTTAPSIGAAEGTSTSGGGGGVFDPGPLQVPVANFTFSPAVATVGATVAFTDTSTNTPTSWAWSFDQTAPTAQVDLLALFKTRYPGGTSNLYVSPTGNDANAGTSIAAPKQTLAAALAAASPGTDINMAAGTYPAATEVNVSGSAGNWIRVIGAPGARISRVPSNLGGIPSSCGLYVTGGGYVAFYGIEIEGSLDLYNQYGPPALPNTDGGRYDNGVVLWNGGNHAFWKMHVHHNSSAGFWVSGTESGSNYGRGLDICYCLIHNQGTWDPYGPSGISIVKPGAGGSDAFNDGYSHRFIGNIIYGCEQPYQQSANIQGNGIMLDDYDLKGFTGKVLVAFNLIVGCGGRGIHQKLTSVSESYFNTCGDSLYNIIPLGKAYGPLSIGSGPFDSNEPGANCKMQYNIGFALPGANQVGNVFGTTHTWSNNVFLRGTGGSSSTDPTPGGSASYDKNLVGPAGFFTAYTTPSGAGGPTRQTVTSVENWRPKDDQVIRITPPAALRTALQAWPDASGYLRSSTGDWAIGAMENPGAIGSSTVASTAQNPTHVWTTTGTKTVTLTATNAAGSNSVQKTVVVTNPSGQLPVANFSVGSQAPNAKAYQNHFYSFPYATDDGNISNADIATRASQGWWGTSFSYGYAAGHPNNTDLAANTVVSRLKTQGSHAIQSYWVLNPTSDSPSGYGIFFAPWFSDAAWTTAINTWVTRATEMKDLGGLGIWMDHERFTGTPDGLFSFSNGDMFTGTNLALDTATKRAKVIARGEQLGAALIAAFPGMRLNWYVAHAIAPKSLGEYVYGAGAGGVPEIPLHNTATWWPFVIGVIKAFCSEGGQFVHTDYRHYEPRSNPQRDNQMLYGNYSWMATVSRGIVSQYGEAVWATCAPNCHYNPFLFLDGDSGGYYTAYTAQQTTDMVTSARNHSMYQSFATFFLHPLGDGGAWQNWGIAGSQYLARVPGLQAAGSAAVAGDPPPTITVTSANRTGTVTGTATGTRGVRYVYWTPDGGVTKRAASMTVVNTATGTEVSPSNTSLTASAMNLRVNWTITGVASTGEFIVEDAHGMSATEAGPTGVVAGSSAQFTDTSTNIPTSWTWVWGDGTANSTTQNPTHTYTTAGTYQVTLTATNANGSNSITKTVLVTGSAAPPSGGSDLLSLFRTTYPCAQSRVIYVDGATGNDANPGTTSAPMRSIQAALNAAAAGTEIIVRAGRYAALNTVACKGALTNWIRVIADPGVYVGRVPGSGDDPAGFRFVGGQFVAIYGFEIQGSQDIETATGFGDGKYDSGINLISGNNAAIWRCHIHDTGSHGIGHPGNHGDFGAADICYNLIHDGAKYDPYAGSGVSINNPANVGTAASDGYHYRLVGNVIYKQNQTVGDLTDGNAIIFDLFTTKGFTGKTYAAFNLLVGCGGRGVHELGSNNCEFYFNTSVDNVQTLTGTWDGEISFQNGTNGTAMYNIGAARSGRNRVGLEQAPADHNWSNNLFLRGTGGSEPNDPSPANSGSLDKTAVGPTNYFVNYTAANVVAPSDWRPKDAQAMTVTPSAAVRTLLSKWPDYYGFYRGSGAWSYGAFEPPAGVGSDTHAPVASFLVSPVSPTQGVAATFTDTSSNTPTSWAWDFGDTGTSSSQNPTHTYSAAGTYIVKLTATNANGSSVSQRTITVQGVGGVGEPVADFTFAPIVVSTTPVTLETFGAVGNGSTDDTTAINNALATGGALRLTAGKTYKHNGVLIMGVAGTKLYGATGAKLYGAVQTASALRVDAANCEIRDLTVDATSTVRQTTPDATLINIKAVDGTVVDNCTLTNSPSASIFIEGATNFQITNNTVTGGRADGIHMTAGAHGTAAKAAAVIGNNVHDIGDDGIAMVSYTSDAAVVHHIHVARNTVSNITAGRGISVPGGEDITIRDNFVSNTSAAGIYLVSETGDYTTYAPKRVQVLNNTLNNCNTNGAVQHGGIYIEGRVGSLAPQNDFNAENITVEGGSVANSGTGTVAVPWHIGVAGGTTAFVNILIRNVAISGPVKPVFYLNNPGTKISLLNNTFNGAAITNTVGAGITATVGPIEPTLAPATATTSANTYAFTDTSTNTPTSWAWNFGDGSPVSTLRNPTHTFPSSGVYYVTLEATNANGSDTVAKPVGLPVTPPPAGTLATYQSENAAVFGSAYPGDPTGAHVLTGIPTTSGYHGTGFVGTFGKVGEGVRWSVSSATAVQVTLRFRYRSITPVMRSVAVNGALVVSNATLPATAATWDTNSWGEHVVSAFLNAGTNTIEWRIDSGVNQFADSDDLTVAAAGPQGSPPTASFSMSTLSAEVGASVTFTDTSTGGPTEWSWSFGDGGTSTSQNPSHAYTAAGTRTVTLTARNAFGFTTSSRTITIVLTPGGYPPVPGFTFSPTKPVIGDTVTFTDTSTNSPSSWLWSFGDGTSTTTHNPTHVYSTAGNFTVSLHATNDFGAASVSKVVPVTNPSSPGDAGAGSGSGGSTDPVTGPVDRPFFGKSVTVRDGRSSGTPVVGAPVVAMYVVGQAVTLTMGAPHNFLVGDVIIVSGLGPDIDNQFSPTQQSSYIITATTPTTITFSVT